ncbi:MAG: DUF3368 domain-containing protein [Chitinophagales bacterium]|nr:DUF3368 domain-containing protein [Chitinophagales bacterium]
MHEVIISDASILIVFHKIDELDLLLKVYEKLIVTPEVVEEFGEQLPNWITVQSVKDRKYFNLLKTQVDAGEASAIALATEFDEVLLLLDDLKARKLAIQLNLKITGTLGIIHKAKQMKIIDEVKPIINKLLQTNFRISNNIIEEILKINDEL